MVQITECLLIICLWVQVNSSRSSGTAYDDRERYGTGDSSEQLIVAQYAEPIRDGSIINPLFYGWFYAFDVSDSLRLITEKYLATSYDFVPEFTNFLDKAMYENNITDPFAYYSKPVDPVSGRIDPYFHTTAKFCGRKDCTSYWEKKAGKQLGKGFQMHLIGLFFTRRVFGIRVKLTQEEQSIFEIDERQNTFQAVQESEIYGNSTEFGKIFTNSIVNSEYEYEGYFQRGKASHPLYPGIHFNPQSPDFHPTESKAHITVGCAPNIEPEQTGLDLLEIIDLEISAHIFHQDFSIGGDDIPISTIRQFGGDGEGDELAFVIYPTEKMVTDATFSVYL